MLAVTIDHPAKVAVFEPNGPLTGQDFSKAVAIIDPWIEANGRLNGLVIRTKSFPGWESFGAFTAHLRFVKDHHEKVRRVALVTDSLLGEIGENIASHFVGAEIEHFDYDEIREAAAWAAAAD
jgi:hypothetical protein